MRVFKHFDRIRIINLASRKDRRREMDAELQRIGLIDDPRVSYFAAIRPSDAGTFSSIGARGCYESQQQILREAVEANESVLILEDDCEFIKDAGQHEAPKDCDIFYGAYYAANPDDLQNSDIMGSHVMGFSQAGAKADSAYLDKMECKGIHPPIDAAYVWFRRAHPDVTTCFAATSLAMQRPSRSDVAELKWFDRTPIVRTGVSALRAMRRSIKK